ncbi:hypothetical protein SAMN05216363_1983 [Pseudomonas sihuiensis]|uniref:Uncharacterized protein n=1 Tax=Pseudomonas sihuiensis TaxID=1274359 RepID=A0A1H2LRM4_9PSED|nr:hypothetical protein SAMN05216363_1983 [Pseudomonas sihuiensis]
MGSGQLLPFFAKSERFCILLVDIDSLNILSLFALIGRRLVSMSRVALFLISAISLSGKLLAVILESCFMLKLKRCCAVIICALVYFESFAVQ